MSQVPPAIAALYERFSKEAQSLKAAADVLATDIAAKTMALEALRKKPFFVSAEEWQALREHQKAIGHPMEYAGKPTGLLWATEDDPEAEHSIYPVSLDKESPT